MVYLCTINSSRDDRLGSNKVIETREELEIVIADTSSFNTIIFRKDFVDNYFSMKAFSNFIANMTRVNRNIHYEFEDFELYSNVDKDLYDKIRSCRSVDDLLMIFRFYGDKCLLLLDKIFDDYERDKTQDLIGSTVISNLQSSIDDKDSTILSLQEELDIAYKNKAYAQDKLDVLIGRINYQYNININDSKIFRSTDNRFDKILYFKEITRVQYVDTLIDSLRDIIRIMYGIPVRFVCIESYYANGKIDLYPQLKPHYRLTENDVARGDILMLGMQQKLMDDILKNTSNTSILIVLDRSGYESPFIVSNNVEYIYTASSVSDVKEDIPKSRIISYDRDTLNIPYIKKYNSLTDLEKKQEYSSLDIIKQLVNLIRK